MRRARKKEVGNWDEFQKEDRTVKLAGGNQGNYKRMGDHRQNPSLTEKGAGTIEPTQVIAEAEEED